MSLEPGCGKGGQRMCATPEGGMAGNYDARAPKSSGARQVEWRGPANRTIARVFTRHCERSEAIRMRKAVAGLLQGFALRNGGARFDGSGHAQLRCMSASIESAAPEIERPAGVVRK